VGAVAPLEVGVLLAVLVRLAPIPQGAVALEGVVGQEEARVRLAAVDLKYLWASALLDQLEVLCLQAVVVRAEACGQTVLVQEGAAAHLEIYGAGENLRQGAQIVPQARLNPRGETSLMVAVYRWDLFLSAGVFPEEDVGQMASPGQKEIHSPSERPAPLAAHGLWGEVCFWDVAPGAVFCQWGELCLVARCAP